MTTLNVKLTIKEELAEAAKTDEGLLRLIADDVKRTVENALR